MLCNLLLVQALLQGPDVAPGLSTALLKETELAFAVISLVTVRHPTPASELTVCLETCVAELTVRRKCDVESCRCKDIAVGGIERPAGQTTGS